MTSFYDTHETFAPRKWLRLLARKLSATKFAASPVVQWCKGWRTADLEVRGPVPAGAKCPGVSKVPRGKEREVS